MAAQLNVTVASISGIVIRLLHSLVQTRHRQACRHCYHSVMPETWVLAAVLKIAMSSRKHSLPLNVAVRVLYSPHTLRTSVICGQTLKMVNWCKI